VKALLTGFEGLSDIDDDLPYGKQELTLTVTERGRAFGFTTASVGRQVRHAFEGAIAKRFARGDEEVKVRLRYPRAAVDEAALLALPLRGTQGHEVPLDEVVAMRERVGFAQINRENGTREVAIFAEVDEALTNANQVIEALSAGPLPEIAQRYGLAYAFKGKAEEQATTLADMRLGAMVALAGIYLVLAWVFASYARPLVVMAVIPFGLIGAVAGHLVMGYDLTMLSLIALLGLAGILVNDSIILVTSVDGRLRDGEAPYDAIVNGSRDRLRAVILTSLTTIGGLLPLLFETSLQAQFLIPMAITMVFGLMVASILVLFVVPAFIGVQEDAKSLFSRWRTSPSRTGA
jgi:multidrug efflux pump subunit AcrB